MASCKQVYKCDVCGNVVELLHSGAGVLVCCDQPMVLQEENTVDASKEKHIPIVEKIDGGVIVKVSSVEHPMLDTHYIEWIELHTEKKIYRKYLSPKEKPQAEFLLEEEVLFAREFCNVHRLWKS